jgi:hypothetical protein
VVDGPNCASGGLCWPLRCATGLCRRAEHGPPRMATAAGSAPPAASAPAGKPSPRVEQGVKVAQAWERTPDRPPLMSCDDLSRWNDLCRRGFGQPSRQLPVEAPFARAGAPGGQPISRDAGDGRTGQVGQHGSDPGGLLR